MWRLCQIQVWHFHPKNSITQVVVIAIKRYIISSLFWLILAAFDNRYLDQLLATQEANLSAIYFRGKVELEHSHTQWILYCFPLCSVTAEWRRSFKTICPTKMKIFTFWFFTENVFWLWSSSIKLLGNMKGWLSNFVVYSSLVGGKEYGGEMAVVGEGRGKGQKDRRGIYSMT